MDSYHPGTECLDPIQKLALLEKRKASSGAYDAERARKELDLINQMMSVRAINQNSKKCPGGGRHLLARPGPTLARPGPTPPLTPPLACVAGVFGGGWPPHGWSVHHGHGLGCQAPSPPFPRLLQPARWRSRRTRAATR
jgi:hypothetical protein